MNQELYILPSAHPLHPYVLSFFRLRAAGAYSAETILPKVTVNLLFNLGAPLRVIYGSGVQSLHQSCSYLDGPATRANTSQPQGEVHLCGVGLRMETCAALLPLPLNEVVDLPLEGALVWKDTDLLCERLYEAPDFSACCEILTRWLLPQVALSPRVDMLRHACHTLDTSDCSVSDLAYTLNLTPRHLRRLFVQQVGISPMQYRRLKRFTKAVPLIHTTHSLTEVAYAAGYFDQAHFCRDFSDFAGMTPRAYRSHAHHLPGHLFSA